MLTRISLVALALSVSVAAPTFATSSKVSLSAAEQICFDRAERFAQTPRYFAVDEFPTPNQIKDKYRACVYAKSGEYPAQKLIVRGQRLKLHS